MAMFNAVELLQAKEALLETLIETNASYEEIAEGITIGLQAFAEELDVAISAEQAAHAAKLAKLNKKLAFWFIVGLLGIVGCYVLYERVMQLEADKEELEDENRELETKIDNLEFDALHDN